ncbi:hypothetical protein CSW98_12510 [Vibrio sp. HA2012]|nr:hypothetical protein CSW98_12510 [Vibrio sp. HA2012]
MAYAGITAVPTATQMVGTFADTLSSFFPGDKANEFKKQFPKVDSTRLQTNPITIEPGRLRLDLQDITELFGNDSVKDNGNPTVKSADVTVASTVEVTASTETNSATQQVLTHPIEQIVLRILQAFPDARADQIWNLIREDVKRESNRIYDIDSAVISVTADDIVWFGKGIQSENEMGYEAFRKNTVYKVRKYLKASSES